MTALPVSLTAVHTSDADAYTDAYTVGRRLYRLFLACHDFYLSNNIADPVKLEET